MAGIKVDGRFDVDLNRRRVIYITYLLSMAVALLSAAAFIYHGWLMASSVHLLGALASFLGFVLAFKGYSRASRILFPVACAAYITFCTFLFYGSNSNFMWLLIVLAAYSVTGFRVESGKAQLMVCGFALMTFTFIKLFAPPTTNYVSQDVRLLIDLCTFVASSVLIVLIAGVVVTKLRTLNEHLRNLAEVDDLTKLSNRRKVLAEAVNVFADSIINNQHCCFAILDMDHFKTINDRFGHEVGDLLLASFAQVMLNNTRRGDWVGRYGGEEFVIVMPNTHLQEAMCLMETLRIQVADLAIPIEGVDVPLKVTISIGVASINDETVRYEQILARADQALYRAKDSGRNCVKSNPS